MLRVDMTARQATAAVALLQQALLSMEEMPSYETLEALVLACRALREAEELPEASDTPSAPRKSRPQPRKEPEAGGAAPSPAKEAALFKRQTLDRLLAYVNSRPGATGRVASAAGIPAETVARMLMREKYQIETWRQVAAALDKLEGGDENADS